MSLDAGVLSSKIVDSIMSINITDGISMGESLDKMAELQNTTRENLPQYISMENTWESIITEIIDHIKDDMVVGLAAEIDELKTIFKPPTLGGSWLVVPQDGGPALQSALSNWASSTTDDGVT